MLNVQKFLRESVAENPLGELESQLAIKVNDYPEQGIVMLNYHMLDSPKTHPITIECRSLILNRITFDIVSRKFDRFFNLGENPEFYSDFNFESCHILSKEDGSLIGVYYNPITEKYSISTRSMANAEGNHTLGDTWYNRIRSAFGFNSDEEFQEFWSLVSNSQKWTYIFEFIGPENRIVTPYKQTEMVFIGASSIDGDWMKLEDMKFQMKWFSKLNIRLPEFYATPKTIDELIIQANELKDLKEGFVIWEPNTNKRQKIKSIQYIAVHAIRGENTLPTRKNIFNLIFTGDMDEFLTYFPEYTELFKSAQDEIFSFEYDLSAIWHQVKNIDDQKTFALAIKDVPRSFILFMAKKQNKHPIQVLHELSAEKKADLFK
jgi:hypothetical protein